MSAPGLNMGKSRLEMQKTIDIDIQQLDSLILDEQWTNIPVPVRNTFEGLMEFCKRTARYIISNDISVNVKMDHIMLNNQRLEEKIKKNYIDHE